MNNWRISMHKESDNVSYVKFDWYVNYKPTKWTFNLYLNATKEAVELKEISWALITRRNVVLASSKDDKPVTSQDFDSFDEKLYFRETIKWWKVISKGLTYWETKEKADSLFYTNSFRLASCYYLVTEKWAVLKLSLSWTTRSKVNQAMDDMKAIDFLTFTVSDETVLVWSGSRSKEVYEIGLKESTKEYNRVAVDKINWTVNTLKKILESKWSNVWTVESSWPTTPVTKDTVEEPSVDTDDLPI